MPRKDNVCQNRYHGDGARGACYISIEPSKTEGRAYLDVGWSSVCVYRKEIPVSWLAELVAIATAYDGGVAGFLAKHNYGGEESYALTCDPAT